jgi:WD40 repeat protein
LSIGLDKKCIVWDLKSRKQLQKIIMSNVPEYAFFISCDSMILTANKHEITVWDIITGIKLANLETNNEITACFEDFKGNLIYTTYGSYVGLNKLTLKEIFRHTLPIGFIAQPYGDSIFISNTILNCGFSSPTPNTEKGIVALPTFKAPEKKIISLMKHKTLLLNCKEGLSYYVNEEIIQVKKISTDINLKLYGHPFTLGRKSQFEIISSADVSPNFLIVGYDGGKIKIYNSKNCKILQFINHHETTVNDITVSPDEKYFATCSSEEIILWDMQSFRPIHCFRNSSGNITTFNLSSDNKKLAIVSSNGKLQHWNLETNEINIGQIPTPVIYEMTYVKNVRMLSDSITELSILHGSVEDGYFKRPTEYIGRWLVYKNEIELKPLRKYGVFDEKISLKGGEPQAVTTKSGEILIKANLNSLEWYKNEGANEIRLKFSVVNAHDDKISCLRIDEENDLLYSSSEDGSLKIWTLKDGKEIVTLLSYEKDFLYLSPENFYYSSKGSVQNVGFRKGLCVYPFDQFDIIYNRPEKVLSRLPFAGEQELQLFKLAYSKRIKWLGLREDNIKSDVKSIPELKIESEKIKSTNKKKYLLSFSASDSLRGITKINVLINGVSYREKNYQGKKQVADSVSIQLSQGNNFIQIFATNSFGISSFKEGFFVEQTSSEKPNLYVLTIGSGKFNQKEFDLKYAGKDALDVASFFKKNRAFKKIHTKTIINEEVTSASVMSAIEKLNNISVDDHVIVFFAGHGILDANLNYFLSTTEVNFISPSKKGISYDSLLHAIEKIPARSKVFFIDACHSGELDKDDVIKSEETYINEGKLVFRSIKGGVVSKEGAVGLKKSLEFSKMIFTDLRNNNGVTVISSAGGAEYAIEGEKWNNGIFTYCLLNGMKKRIADINKDGKIFLSELQEYLTGEVKRVSNGLQIPTSRSENIYNDFFIK